MTISHDIATELRINRLPQERQERLEELRGLLDDISAQEYLLFFPAYLIGILIVGLVFTLFVTAQNTEARVALGLGVPFAGLILFLVFCLVIYPKLPHVQRRKKPFVEKLKQLLEDEPTFTQTHNDLVELYPFFGSMLEKSLKLLERKNF